MPWQRYCSRPRPAGEPHPVQRHPPSLLPPSSSHHCRQGRKQDQQLGPHRPGQHRQSPVHQARLRLPPGKEDINLHVYIHICLLVTNNRFVSSLQYATVSRRGDLSPFSFDNLPSAAMEEPRILGTTVHDFLSLLGGESFQIEVKHNPKR